MERRLHERRVEAAMDKLSKNNPEKLIDVLCERLTFERAGVRAYDAIIAKLEMSNDIEIHRTLQAMRVYRDEEEEHVEWLQCQIRALGGDAQRMTEMARLVEREAVGIESIVLDGDNEPSHLFHALLAAELADNAGWALLVALADEAGDRDAKKQFKKRLHQEEEHLAFVRRAVEGFACATVLGEPLSMPVSA
jgi:bacterioferritin (cytochrome b1)